MNMPRRAVLAFGLATAALAAGTARADDFPSKAIHFEVGYAAGGPTDVIARLIAQEVGRELGQSVIVENRAGANGNIATEYVARAPADGYTLIVNTLSHNVNPLLQPQISKYDPFKDFTPVSLTVVLPQLLVVGESSPYQTLGELVNAAKAQPSKVSFGSAGAGGSAHLAGELLALRSDTKMTHVPFRGNAPALTEVMTGRVSYMFYPMIGVKNYVEQHKLRVLAVTTARRDPDYPNVPTMAEAGYPGFDKYVGPVGFLAPAGTPPAVVEKLGNAIRTATLNPGVSEKLRALGGVVVGSTPAEYREWLKGDQQRWAELIKTAHVKVD